MSSMLFSVLALLIAIGKGDDVLQIDCAVTGNNFRYRAFQTDEGPLVVFGDTNDPSAAVFCLKFEKLFVANDFNKDMCSFTQISNTLIDLETQMFYYTNSSDCSSFSLMTMVNGVNITFSFGVETVDGEDPALKYTFELEGFVYDDSETTANNSLILILRPTQCDDVYDIDSMESSETTTTAAARRRLEESTDLDTGISADDSNDFDLNQLVFRNTPTATVNCNGTDETIDVAMCYDSDDESLVLSFDSFGGSGETCTVVQDPYALLDTSKYDDSFAFKLNMNIFVVSFIAILATLMA